MHNFSPNMLKTYEQCPKKYHFRYVENLSMPVNDSIFATGKNIHALASYFLNNQNIAKLEKSLNEKETELWNYLKNSKYFGYEILKTEYSLYARLNNCYLGGRLDALVKKENKYYILDYKTGSAPKNAVYDYQTMVYLYMVSELYKDSGIIFVYIDLKNKKETEIQLTDELKKEYVSKLENTVNRILKGDFPPSKKDCIHCEYKKVCYDKLLN